MIVRIGEKADAATVQRRLAERGLWVRRLEEPGGPVSFLVEPHSAHADPADLRLIEGVTAVAVEREANPRLEAQPRTVRVGPVALGAGEPPILMAGPCSVESEAQIHALAARVARRGATFLRGGAFKPRTSPYAFHGHGPQALRWMREAADAHGLQVVTEVMSAEDVPAVAAHADLLQIGSRSMQSFPLLRAAAAAGKPILLKRGMSATVAEWMAAAEWCLVHGAPAVIFCERGIRGFDPSTRNLLDLGAVALLAGVHGLPVVVDPSHAAGRRDLLAPLARAAIAAGACGLLLETHDQPGNALSDGPQALDAAAFDALVEGLNAPALPARRRAS